MSEISQDNNQIAIIGWSCRLPGANTIARYWDNLCTGRVTTQRFNKNQLLSSAVPENVIRNNDFVPVRGVIEAAEDFDAAFFGFTPDEANVTDPQQRVLLELAHDAFEDAGYVPGEHLGPVGVFTGTSRGNYFSYALQRRPELIQHYRHMDVMIGTGGDFSSTRISYKLNLTGPSLTIQTACSTSLVAVCVACQSLLTEESEYALAGSCSIAYPQVNGYLYSPELIYSKDGVCRPYDARATGTVFSSGGAIVLLKRLADALRDQDHIHAVIKGFGLNNDGASKAGFTAPSIPGQSSCISMALKMASLSCEQIGLIEGHGTATLLGDPIEVRALTSVFGQTTRAKHFCALSSVKGNIGHTDTAAGIAGLIKAALAVKHGVIPLAANFEAVNPMLSIDDSPFYIPKQTVQISATERFAGVSSFGIGGTNSHVVIGNAPRQAKASSGRKSHVLVLSAYTNEALQHKASALLEVSHADGNLEPTACTLLTGRKEMPVRVAFAAQTAEEFKASLVAIQKSLLAPKLVTGVPKVCWIFPGQGAQWPSTVTSWLASETSLRQACDDCLAFAKPTVRRVWQDFASGTAVTSDAWQQDTELLQPMLFIWSYGVAKCLTSYGLKPDMLVGHSVGEYAAACISGLFNVETGMRLVQERGRLLQATASGRMLAVFASAPETTDYIKSSGCNLDCAAVNGPTSTVVSGSAREIMNFRDYLDSAFIPYRVLSVNRAFHSRLIEPAAAEFSESFADVTFGETITPIICTGGLSPRESLSSPQYWTSQIRRPVMFESAVKAAHTGGCSVFVEIGPASGLLAQVESVTGPDKSIVINTIDLQNHLNDPLAHCLAQMWTAGLSADWSRYYGQSLSTKVSLPSYPYERRLHSLISEGEPREAQVLRTNRVSPHTSDFQLFRRSWMRVSEQGPIGDDRISGHCVVFHLSSQRHRDICASLGRIYEGVVEIVPGNELREVSSASYEYRTSEIADYEKIGSLLAANRIQISGIVHLLCDADPLRWQDGSLSLGASGDLSVISMIGLSYFLNVTSICNPCRLMVATQGAFSVLGTEELNPFAASLIRAAGVVGKENEALKIRCVDFGASHTYREVVATLHKRELSRENIIDFAVRGNYIWGATCEPLPVTVNDSGDQGVINGGVYLIAGGTSGIGMAIAERLIREHNCRVLLFARNDPRAQPIDTWRATKTSKEIKLWGALTENRQSAALVTGDVSSREDLDSAIRACIQKWGRVSGVVHSAGVSSASFGSLETRSMAFNVMQAKIEGTLNLIEACKTFGVSQIVILGSVSGIEPFPGLLAYGAANAFLDAIAGIYKQVKVINWPTWSEIGMGTRNLSNERLNVVRAVRRSAGLSTDIGLRAFELALRSSERQVTVRQQNPRERDVVMMESKSAIPQMAGTVRESNFYPRPMSAGPCTAPNSTLEIKVVEAYEDVLGFRPVGASDDFFSLGGHSLSATSVIGRLRKELGVHCPLNLIFKNPTVSSLAKAIEVWGQSNDQG